MGSGAIGGMSPDYDYLIRYFAELLLSTLWSAKTSAGERRKIFSEFSRVSLEENPQNPPIVGVGVALHKMEYANIVSPVLEIHSTVPAEMLDIEKLLSLRRFKGIPSHVTKTGMIIPCSKQIAGGDSVGHHSGPTGSIGCVVQDTFAGGQKYLLSCNHVLAALNRGQRGQDEIWQPGKKDGGGTDDRIGRLAKYEDILMGGDASNVMDAALCEPDEDKTSQLLPGLRRLGSVRGYVATKDMKSVLDTPVRKEGRETKVTDGVVRMTGSFLVKYSESEKARFDNQLAIYGSKHDASFAKEGDSGALILDGSNKVLGLLFGVARDMDVAYANPIEPILTKFGVRLVK
jgi:hypothetical protein